MALFTLLPVALARALVFPPRRCLLASLLTWTRGEFGERIGTKKKKTGAVSPGTIPFSLPLSLFLSLLLASSPGRMRAQWCRSSNSRAFFAGRLISGLISNHVHVPAPVLRLRSSKRLLKREESSRRKFSFRTVLLFGFALPHMPACPFVCIAYRVPPLSLADKRGDRWKGKHQNYIHEHHMRPYTRLSLSLCYVHVRASSQRPGKMRKN